MPLDLEKLAKKQSSQLGGKGTPRRKVKKVQKNTENDDVKVQEALKNLSPQVIPGISEVNMFQDDGKVLHFNKAQIQAAAKDNTLAIHGRPQVKDVAELMPNILTQLGPENMDKLKALADQLVKANGGKIPGVEAGEAEDEGIPDLVEGENFDKVD